MTTTVPPFPVFPIETPALRPLQVTPVTHEGRQVLVFQDPMGIIENPIAIVPDAILLVILQHADGETDLGKLAEIARQQTDLIITADRIRNVVRELDESLLLLSERFMARWKERRIEWDALPVRRSVVFNGDERDLILEDLEEEFQRHEEGPDAPPEKLDLPNENVRAVISPHIDYLRGGETYAWAYKAVREHTKAKTFIILGTLHRSAAHTFIATRKPYDTPYGLVEVDDEVLGAIEKDFRGELFEEEYLHGSEHTIELQVVYLKKVLGDRSFKIVPILVAPMDEYLYAEPAVDPAQDPEIDSFTQVIRDVMRKYGDDVVLIAGVDLAHCGPEFGHPDPNDDVVLDAIKRQDLEALKSVEAVDATAFFNSFRKTMNSRNVCSIAPIYCALHAMREEYQGKLLRYHQANSEDQTCMVSFASVAFTPKSRIILLS